MVGMWHGRGMAGGAYRLLLVQATGRWMLHQSFLILFYFGTAVGLAWRAARCGGGLAWGAAKCTVVLINFPLLGASSAQYQANDRFINRCGG